MRPQVNWTMGLHGVKWYYIGAFVDNVKRYPREADWIEVVW